MTATTCCGRPRRARTRRSTRASTSAISRATARSSRGRSRSPGSARRSPRGSARRSTSTAPCPCATTGSTGPPRGRFSRSTTLTPPFPADLAQTTTIDGHTVNYIVRVESGTINQSIYRIAILDDPTAPISNPWSPGGTEAGPGLERQAQLPLRRRLRPRLPLGPQRGHQRPCARPAEPRLRRRLRDPQYARHRMQRRGLRRDRDDDQGALHRAVRRAAVHDRLRRLGRRHPAASDRPQLPRPPRCPHAGHLLPGRRVDPARRRSTARSCNRYFDTVANPADWPGSRRSAVDGYAVAADGRTVCQNGWGGFADGLLNPSTRFDAVVPVEVRYHPVNNPTGVRATFFDGLVNVFGRRPADRLRPLRLRQRRRPVRPQRAERRR